MDAGAARAAGDKLIAAAAREFPTNGRCVHCGFRRLYHASAGHEFKPPIHPLVRAISDFVKAVTTGD